MLLRATAHWSQPIPCHGALLPNDAHVQPEEHTDKQPGKRFHTVVGPKVQTHRSMLRDGCPSRRRAAGLLYRE